MPCVLSCRVEVRVGAAPRCLSRTNEGKWNTDLQKKYYLKLTRRAKSNGVFDWRLGFADLFYIFYPIIDLIKYIAY
jgi:hypothetical protein